MVKFSRHTLANGLRILVHEDRSTTLAAVNILYNVGSRDEDPGSTGMAHLFEHLMFGGTELIPEYDRHLLVAGGENNAFTNNDITNYYITLPAANIETAFWLESDRMNLLDFSLRNLDVQKSVVVEEFNQRYLNQPYGDVMLLLRPLVFKVHPYRWPAIGVSPDHIRNVTLERVRQFFFSHYAPNNAILSVTGSINTGDAVEMAEKWFGTIEKRSVAERSLPEEPRQNEARFLEVKRDVPADALYKVWHTCPRAGIDFQSLDLLTDLLAGGESGRLFTKLVRQKKLFSEINAYITSDIDTGMLIIHGRLMKGVDIRRADESVMQVIEELKVKYPPESEMEKVRNKFESSTVFANTSILNKAMNLSFYELMGNPDLINTEVEDYRKVSRMKVSEAALRYIDPAKCSTMYYKSDGGKE